MAKKIAIIVSSAPDLVRLIRSQVNVHTMLTRSNISNLMGARQYDVNTSMGAMYFIITAQVDNDILAATLEDYLGLGLEFIHMADQRSDPKKLNSIYGS
jgi:hypothetical protein